MIANITTRPTANYFPNLRKAVKGLSAKGLETSIISCLVAKRQSAITTPTQIEISFILCRLRDGSNPCFSFDCIILCYVVIFSILRSRSTKELPSDDYREWLEEQSEKLVKILMITAVIIFDTSVPSLTSFLLFCQVLFFYSEHFNFFSQSVLVINCQQIYCVKVIVWQFFLGRSMIIL